MRTGLMIAAAIAWMGSLAVGCTSGPGAVGAPCETKEDCEGDLICDEHEGQASCQEPHGHGETDEGSETGHSHESDTEHSHDSGTETGHDQDTGHSHDSGSDSGHAHDSGSDTGHSHDTGEATTGGVAAECEGFCGCMTAQCSGFAAYPYADEAACLEACAGLSPAELTCFAGFCANAEVEPSDGLEEHWCEHAWGELGTDEC